MNKKAAAIVGGILVLGLGVFGFTKLNSGLQNQRTQQEQSAEQTTVQITDANGEKAELKIFAAKKCYVTIFNFYGNSNADIIFPNELEKMGEISENGILNFPQNGTSFELYTPEGKKESKELFYIVALKEFIDFKKMLGEKTTIENVNKIISDIDDKAEYMAGYVVREK